MKRLLAWSGIFAVFFGFIVLPWMMLDDKPAIEPPAAFHRTELAWVKSLFQKHDPRNQTPDVVYSIQLDETELNRLLNYAVELRRVSGIAAELTPDLATLSATLTIPANPFGRYLNVTAEVADAPGGIRIRSLRLGNLPLPGIVANWAARLTHRWLRQDKTYAELADAFLQVNFSENRATLDYRWDPALLTGIERKSAELLIAREDQMRMLAYSAQLDAIVKRYPAGITVPLVQVIAPLFSHANALGSHAPEENRAALTAVAAYLSGISLTRLLEGDSPSIRRAPRVLLSLHGRRDFAEHFMISAALTVNSSSRLATAIGLIKEEEDANKGSGFSFTDLAANRAGVKLGEHATGAAAVRIQQQLSAARSDADLLPDFRNLPEFMPQDEFERRFGPVGSPRYQKIIARIDGRLAAHPLAQPNLNGPVKQP